MPIFQQGVSQTVSASISILDVLIQLIPNGSLCDTLIQ